MGEGLGGLVGCGDPPSIDKAATQGLAGTANSLAYRTEELEKHFHGEGMTFGGTSAGDPTLLQDSTTPVVVTGGNNVYGTEVIISKGASIEGGSATKKFDLNMMYVSALGAVNNITQVEFFAFAAGTPKVAAAVTATNKITDATNVVADNDKVFFTSIASNTGIDVNTVYFVRARAAGNFEVSLTRGGAAVDIAGADGAVSYVSLGASDANGRALTLQPRITSTYISKVAVNSDILIQELRMPRKACNSYISVRAKATGASNAISFLLGGHTYIA